MALIPARKPYYITHFGQTLSIYLYIYDYADSQPATANYIITKQSFADGVDETLSVDISPFIRDYFAHSEVITIDDNGSIINDDQYLKVDAVVNTVEENHTALDGWVAADSTSEPGLADYTRGVNEDTKGYFTFRNSAFTSVKYHRDNGTVATYTITPTTPYVKFPLVPSDFSLGSTKTLEIELYSASKQKSYFCDVINCDFDQANHYELYFVNKYGLQESVTLGGNNKESVSTKGSSFTRASDNQIKVFNTNGYSSFTVNTGWLREDSKQMVEQVLMSNEVFIVRNFNETIPVEIKSLSQEYKTRKADKMINYTFQLKAGVDILNK